VHKSSKLGQILFRDGAINEQQLVDALLKQSRTGKRLGEIFLANGIITEMRLAEALSTQLEIPMVNLTHLQPKREGVNAIPRRVAERLRLMPLSVTGGTTLFVAMTDPLDILAHDELRSVSGFEITMGVTTYQEIKNNIDRFYSLRTNHENITIDAHESSYTEHIYETTVSDSPLVQLVNNLLNRAIREGASDIHIDLGRVNSRVRYRVDGTLHVASEFPKSMHESVAARLKIMAGMDTVERRKPQDGHILLKVENRYVDLRISIVPTTKDEKIVIRILDQGNSAIGLERLGMEESDMEKVEALCKIPWGMVLATGPTRSGKSTTLYSMLDRVNQTGVNIIALEDPVEYTIEGISQILVNDKQGWGFETALRSILRQDPDKIMIGEIRDGITAQVAVRAAITGHTVLSTLHTNDAVSTLTRMIDIGVPSFLLSAALSGVIAQRLVRKLCPKCKEEYEPSDQICGAIGLSKGVTAWKAVGCIECRQGYKGRTGIYEIMPVDSEIRQLIADGKNTSRIRTVAIDKGMKTLRQSGINRAQAGITSLEEVISVTM